MSFDDFDAQTQSDEYFEGKLSTDADLAEDYLDFEDEIDRPVTAPSNYPLWMYPGDHEYVLID